MIDTSTSAHDLCHALAGEMRDMSALVETLAGALAADEQLVERHLPRLQQFDLIAQQLGECANLLDTVARGDCVGRAVENLRLERMQLRLRAALQAA